MTLYFLATYEGLPVILGPFSMGTTVASIAPVPGRTITAYVNTTADPRAYTWNGVLVSLLWCDWGCMSSIIESVVLLEGVRHRVPFSDLTPVNPQVWQPLS